MKPIIDTILNFTISKKLSVFIIATFLVFTQKLTSEQWIDVALMYNYKYRPDFNVFKQNGTIEIFTIF